GASAKAKSNDLRRGQRRVLLLRGPEMALLNMATRLSALFQIFLVVLFGSPESPRRLHLRHDPFGKVRTPCGWLLNLGLRLRLLFRRVVENRRPVLRSPVGPLP